MPGPTQTLDLSEYDELPQLQETLTFDDVWIRPGYTQFGRSDTITSSRITPSIELELPVIAAPMEFVDAEFAMLVSQLGGVAVTHRYQTIDSQAEQVEKVIANGGRVGAAVGTKAKDHPRIEALLEAGASFLVVDSAHGHKDFIAETIQRIKRQSKVEVMAGNIATAAAAKFLIDAGADSLRVGMGPGSICTTRVVSGMGVGQITAVMDVARVAHKHDKLLIADGGIVHLGDMGKALAAGADAIMMGSKFAATEQAAATEKITWDTHQVPERFKTQIDLTRHEHTFKGYRGMGSRGAKQAAIAAGAEEYHGQENESIVAEGVEGMVYVTGTLEQFMKKVKESIQTTLDYAGFRTIADMHTVPTAHLLARGSAHMTRESFPHDIYVTSQHSTF